MMSVGCVRLNDRAVSWWKDDVERAFM